MTGAPERIWVAAWREGDWSEGDWDDNEGKTLNEKPCMQYVQPDRIEDLEAKLAKALEVKKAQQLMNYYAVEVVVYGATVSRLRNLEDAWTNLRTQATLAELKGETDE